MAGAPVVVEPIDGATAELRRILWAGVAWAGAGMIASGIAIGALLASGWRPMDLPAPAAIAWWLGLLAAAAGMALLVWAGCPVFAFPQDQAHHQKVFSIRVGIVLHLAGSALAALAVMLTPVAAAVS